MDLMIYGLIFGCFIPFLARKISKLIPATAGYILLKIFMPSHYMPWRKLKQNPKYIELFDRYLMRSLGWGIFTAAITYAFQVIFDGAYIGWYIAFLWILLLLVEIDKRSMLLPDILTIPLLILGFGYASQHGTWLATQDLSFISYEENSALGAMFGYVLPIISSMFVVWKYPNAFGGGDIKLLCAIGAWVGFEFIAYIIVLSCFIFAISCLIHKMRAGPFGPAIVYATLIIVLLFFGM